MLRLAILMSIAVACGAQVLSKGKCSTKLSVVNPFDVAMYSGIWYEQYRYPQEKEPGMACVMATYKQEAGGKISVHNEGVANRTRHTIDGHAELTDPTSEDAKLTVKFPSVGGNASYWVLSTNYKTYALVYSCRDLENDQKAISSWILTRSSDALDILDSKVIDDVILESEEALSWLNFHRTSFSDDACDGAASTSVTLLAILFTTVLLRLL